MKKMTTILFATILFCSMSCDKEKEVATWAQGTVITASSNDVSSQDTIPFAKVYLMSNNLPFTGTFNNWQFIDSTHADDNGYFRFDYSAIDGTRYGLYPQKEHYFDYREVQFHSRSSKEEGVNLVLFPKAYLKVRVKDEPPFSGITSMHIPTNLGQETLNITGSPIDTTVIKWLHPPSESIIWYFHEEDKQVLDGTFIACPSFDTCYYELFF